VAGRSTTTPNGRRAPRALNLGVRLPADVVMPTWTRATSRWHNNLDKLETDTGIDLSAAPAHRPEYAGHHYCEARRLMLLKSSRGLCWAGVQDARP
jgi:hypothetical protein